MLSCDGGMPEWLIGPVLKTGGRETRRFESCSLLRESVEWLVTLVDTVGCVIDVM